MEETRSRKAPPPKTGPSLPPRLSSANRSARKKEKEEVEETSAPIPVRRPTRGKAKSRKAASMSAGSKIVWILSGFFGGIIGGVIWGAIAYFTGYEIGYVAVGVGALVGICVKSQAGGHAGFETGLGAAVITITCVLLAQYFSLAFMATKHIQNTIIANPQKVESPDYADMINVFAYKLAAEKEQAGTKLIWPQVADDQLANTPPEDLFPAGIYAEAKTKWNVKSLLEKEKLIAEEYEARKQAVGTALIENGTFMHIASNLNLFEVLGPMSYLFIGIAAVTAFRMGGGTE